MTHILIFHFEIEFILTAHFYVDLLEQLTDFGWTLTAALDLKNCLLVHWAYIQIFWSQKRKTITTIPSTSVRMKNNWAVTWQNQQNECVPSEDSDQPGHPPSLIRVYAVRMKKPWVLSYPLSAQRRLWSDWVDAQADLSLRWAHTHFVGFVMSQLK